MSKEIFDIEFEKIKNELIREYDRLGMRASGSWADELEVVSTKNTGKILGLSYSEQLESGRTKTSGGGDGTLIKRITQWIKDKGIVSKIKGDISVSSLAFLITRKIHKEGWKREEHGGLNLVSNVITPQRMQIIIDKIGVNEVFVFTERLKKEIRKIAI